MARASAFFHLFRLWLRILTFLFFCWPAGKRRRGVGCVLCSFFVGRHSLSSGAARDDGLLVNRAQAFPGRLGVADHRSGSGLRLDFVFPDRLSWGIRSECRTSGVAASSATGLPQSIGMVVCIPLLLAPGVQIAAAVACLALWLVFWAQSRGFREKLLALALA